MTVFRTTIALSVAALANACASPGAINAAPASPGMSTMAAPAPMAAMEPRMKAMQGMQGMGTSGGMAGMGDGKGMPADMAKGHQMKADHMATMQIGRAHV